MERITKWSNTEGWTIPICDENGRKITLEEVCKRLAAYENTGLEPEEIGNSIHLGQVVYSIENEKSGVEECKVIAIQNSIEHGCRLVTQETVHGGYLGFYMEELERTFFLSKLGAEQALALRKGGTI